MLDVLLVILYVASGVVAAWDARRKGYDDRIFTLGGILLGPLALLIMLFLPQKSLAVGTRVRPAAPIALESGRKIPPSHVTTVQAVTEVDGVVLCQVTSPSQTVHWVPQEALTRVRG